MVDATQPGIWFRANGEEHSLRILRVDKKADADDHDISVYEAMVDASEYIYFEHDESKPGEVWDLLSETIAAYIESVKDDKTQVRAHDRFITQEEI